MLKGSSHLWQDKLQHVLVDLNAKITSGTFYRTMQVLQLNLAEDESPAKVSSNVNANGGAANFQNTILILSRL